MGKKTVRGHDIANRFVYSLKSPELPLWGFVLCPFSIFIFHIQPCSDDCCHKFGCRKGHPYPCHLPEPCEKKGDWNNQNQSPQERDDLGWKRFFHRSKVHGEDDIKSGKD